MKGKTLIIAEAGVNHNGDLVLAKRLVEVAAKAGADFVKFQTFKTELLVAKNAPQADYQKKNLNNEGDNSQFSMLKKLELSKEDHLELIEHCKTNNIAFLSTAFDMESLDLLVELGIDLFKIPSGEITNYTYIRKIGSFAKSVIVSTGMAEMEEIKQAVELLIASGTPKQNITVLHCTTEYPTPIEEVNLRAMHDIASTLGVSVGYSDHTEGIEVSVAAVAMGASIIEKHFTLDKSLPGPDHKASLNPEELISLVNEIRTMEIILGDGIKRPTPSEAKNKVAARKSLHFREELKVGTLLKEEHLIAKRPGNGISPMQIPSLIGKKLVVNVDADQLLQWEQLQ